MHNMTGPDTPTIGKNGIGYIQNRIGYKHNRLEQDTPMIG